MTRGAHCPGFTSDGQFLLGLGALQEKASGLWPDKLLRQRQKPVERRASPGGDNIRHMRCDGFDSARPYRNPDIGDSRYLAQKRSLASVGLDQLDLGHAEDRQNQPWEPCPATHINQAARALREQRQELRGIEKVPPPWVGKGTAADEIDPCRPLGEQPGIGFQSL